MKNWTDIHIGIVYYSAILIGLIMSLLSLYYLRPIKFAIKKITAKYSSIWNHSFKVTVILSGLIGAMSVSFTDCHGSYQHLSESSFKTVMKGLEQVSKSIEILTGIFILWFILFLVLWMIRSKKREVI